MKMDKIKLTFLTKEFKTFLRSIAKINYSVILQIKDKVATVMASAPTEAIIILSKLNLPDVPGNEVETELPIIDINKFIKICDFEKNETLELTIEGNLVKYANDSIKLKFYLAERSIVDNTRKITEEQLNKFPIGFSALVPKDKIVQLEKGFSFVKDGAGTVKIYFYTEDNILYGELTDYTSNATDSYRVALCDSFQGSITQRIPIKLESWLLLEMFRDEVIFESANVKTKNGIISSILFVRQNSNSLNYSYLLQPLKN